MLSLRISDAQLKELRGAIAKGPRAAGARSRRPTAPSCSTSRQIVYLRVESDEHRVGF